MAVIAALRQYVYGKYNNYLILKSVFWHTLNRKPLYDNYPTEYFDSNHYGPFFSVIIAPFALLPDGVALILWNVSNISVLLLGIFSLPVSGFNKKIIAWIIIYECFTALLLFHFNIALTGLILLSFSCIEKRMEMKSAFAMLIGFAVKLYGIAALAFFFFIKGKKQFLLSILLFAFVFFYLPMLISGPGFIIESYQQWFTVHIFKNHDNELKSKMSNPSILGFIRIVMGLYINALYGYIFAFLLLVLGLLRTKMYPFVNFRLMILAYVLICLIIFNTNIGLHTYIIGSVGVVIWFACVKKNIGIWGLFIFTVITTGLSSTDVYSKYIRETYVVLYVLKALTYILIWLDLSFRILFFNFSDNNTQRRILRNKVVI